MNQINTYFKERYNSLVKKMTYRAGSVQNAEDVVQEAFTRAMQYHKTFDPRRKEFGAWFNTILNNSLRDFKREERNYGMGMEFDEEAFEGFDFDGESKETLKEIRNRIKKKKSGSNEILTLYFVLGYTPKDIGNCTPHPRGTILSTITRFKKEVKDWYDKSLCGGLGSQRASGQC